MGQEEGMVLPASKAAKALNADGIIVEIHPNQMKPYPMGVNL